MSSALFFQDVYKGFLCNRRLWKHFGVSFGIVTVLVLMYALSLQVNLEYSLPIFILFCLPLLVVIFLYRKKHPTTVSRDIFSSSPLGQKVGAFLFESVFSGGIIFGSYMFVIFFLDPRMTPDRKITTALSVGGYICVFSGLIMGATMAAMAWSDCITDTKKKIAAKGAVLALFLLALALFRPLFGV